MMAVISLTDVIKLFGGIHKTFASVLLWSAGFIASTHREDGDNDDDEHFYSIKWFMFFMHFEQQQYNNIAAAMW